MSHNQVCSELAFATESCCIVSKLAEQQLSLAEVAEAMLTCLIISYAGNGTTS